jgi:hypothetical protein
MSGLSQLSCIPAFQAASSTNNKERALPILFITACWPWSWFRPFRFVFGTIRQRVVAIAAVVNAGDRRHAGEMVAGATIITSVSPADSWHGL